MRDIPPVPDHDIELSGGALALDFANTVGGTHVPPTHAHLRGYEDIVDFAVLAGAFDAKAAKRLAQGARREPRRAEAVYELGITLREAIWRVFSALASGEAPRDADLDLIGDAAAAGAARSRLVYDRARPTAAPCRASAPRSPKRSSTTRAASSSRARSWNTAPRAPTRCRRST